MKIKPSRLIINGFSYLIVIISFYYIISALKGYKLSAFFINGTILTILYLLFFSLIKSFFLFINGYIFNLILEFHNNGKLALSTILSIYIKSNITKYIPSNIMPYVSRIYLGNEAGLGKLNITVSGFLEIFLGLSITAMIILMLLLSGIAQFPNNVNFKLNYPKIFLLLLFFIMCSLLLFFIYLIYLHKKKRLSKREIINDFNRVYNKYFNFRFLALYFKIFILSIISFVLSGIVFYISTYAILNYQLKYSDFFNIAICLGIAGYSAILTPGVPGGIGVKESVSVLLISLYGYMKAPIILAVILFRMVGIFSDILSYFFMYLWGKYKRE